MNRKSAAVMNWRNRTKIKLIEYKGGKCSRCGYDKKVPAAYDFHHNDPGEKDFGIGGKSWSYERLKTEADKCTLVCCRCHSEIHWELSQEERCKRAELEKTRLQEKVCNFCGSVFQPAKGNQLFCSVNCSRLNSRKVDRPTKEQLRKEIDTMSWLAIGRKHGVSDNAVRKWARKYSLL